MMAKNWLKEGWSIFIHDKYNAEAVESLVQEGAKAVSDVKKIWKHAKIVVTMLPNDDILHSVTEEFLPLLPAGALHISCSTVSPFTSRALAAIHTARGIHFVGAPIFARPDGVAKKQAYFVVGGTDPQAIERANPVLMATGAKVYKFSGEDAGAGSVVKCCGNYLIAASIQSIGEALALAESQGLDRVQVMEMLTETIFDCLIYKGYGQRVSTRDHRPGGFSLELGYKDVALVRETARLSKVPMPFASVLHDRFLAAKNRGLGDMDWSAVALGISQDAGVNLVVNNNKSEGGEERGKGAKKSKKK